MPRRPLSAKPGTHSGHFKPDRILNFKVTEPSQLLDFLYSVLTECKRTTVKDYLKYRQVMVNGTVSTQFNQALNPGDTVLVNTTREFQTFYNSRLKIVYEDDDLIVVNKGYGLLSMGTDRKKDGTAYSLLREYIKRKDPRNKLFIVHRLDQHTSGLMVFAKSEKVKDAMQHNWNNIVLERKYIAVIDNGPLDPEEGEIRSYLAENSAHEVYVTDNPQEGKLAVTRYRTLRSRGRYSMVELSLETGRKNQIRVHMSHSGHPIVGDRRYGSDISPIHRLALHAKTLRFAHPVTRKDMNFTCPEPAGFAKLV